MVVLPLFFILNRKLTMFRFLFMLLLLNNNTKHIIGKGVGMGDRIFPSHLHENLVVLPFSKSKNSGRDFYH